MRRFAAISPYSARSASRLSRLLAWAALTGINLLAGSVYSIQNLGGLGSGPALVSAIDGTGAALGYVTDARGNQVPTVFAGGVATPLAGTGQANGLNASGTIVGTSYVNGQSYATEWSNGQINNLGIAGFGTSINNSGEIAGGYQTSSGQLHAFTWSNGNLIDLGTFKGGTSSSAYGVNSSGEIAGTSSVSRGNFRAFFSNGNGLVNLGTFGGSNSHAAGINDAGEVVGNAQTSRGFANAFLWSNGSLTNLGTLGGTQSYAYAINDAGTVVGSSWTSGNRTTDAFICSGGVMLDLNGLLPLNSGWTIDAAYAINGSGDIIGTGMFNGQNYAVELLAPGTTTPASSAVPEPAALLLAGLGLLIISRLGRSKRKARRPT